MKAAAQPRLLCQHGKQAHGRHHQQRCRAPRCWRHRALAAPAASCTSPLPGPAQQVRQSEAPASSRPCTTQSLRPTRLQPASRQHLAHLWPCQSCLAAPHSECCLAAALRRLLRQPTSQRQQRPAMQHRKPHLAARRLLPLPAPLPRPQCPAALPWRSCRQRPAPFLMFRLQRGPQAVSLAAMVACLRVCCRHWQRQRQMQRQASCTRMLPGGLSLRSLSLCAKPEELATCVARLPPPAGRRPL